MSPEQIAAFRNALKSRAQPPPPPQPPAAPPKMQPPPRGGPGSSSSAAGSGGGGSSKARGKSPSRSASKYYRSSPAQEPNDVDDLPQEANSNTVPFPAPPPPPPPSQPPKKPQEASQSWQPPPPPSIAPAPAPAPAAPPPADPRLLALPVAERSKVATRVSASNRGINLRRRVHGSLHIWNQVDSMKAVLTLSFLTILVG